MATTMNAVQVSPSTKGLIIADGLCPLIAQLRPGAHHELVALGQQSNPLQGITAELVSRRRQGRTVGRLHIVAHGRPGAFQIGGQWVDFASLIANIHHLAQWQVPSIALWSCEVGSDRNFAALLEELTGAKVWLSSRSIGRSGKESYWQLQNQTQLQQQPQSSKSPRAPFRREALRSWSHQLAGTVLNVNNVQLKFETKTFLTGHGDGTGNGDIVLFTNVITIGGQAVDAVVTTALVGATVATYDGTSVAAGKTLFFQPDLSVDLPVNVGDLNGVKFKIDFYKQGTYAGPGTGEQVTLRNFVVNSYDIDCSGGGSQRQFQAFKGFATYELANSNQLTTTVLGDGSVLFVAKTNANNSAYAADGYRVKVNYDQVQSFELFTGATKAASGSWNSAAIFALDFSVGPSWSGPTTVTGTPAPSLIYSTSTFTEAVANDGSIGNNIAITLGNGSFSGADGQLLGGVSFSSVPVGLMPTVTRMDNTHATLSLTGSATSHAKVNGINNLIVTFGGSAFGGGLNADAVTGAIKSDLIVDFNDPGTALIQSILINSISVDSGLSATDFITNDSNGLTLNATLSGALGSSEILEYSNDNGSSWSNVSSSITGGTSVSYVDSGLTSTNTVKFRVKNTLSGTVGAFATQLVTVDTSAPAAPSITSVSDDVSPVTGNVVSGGSTNDTDLLLAGTAEALSSVSIYNGATLLGSVIANGSGAWSYNATGLLNGSIYGFKATAADGAGNISTASSIYTVTVDTSAPAAPSITSVSDDVSPVTGNVVSGGSTNDTDLLLAGTAEALSSVSIYNGATLLGSVIANGSGAWSYNATGLLNGSIYGFKATAADGAGNISTASSIYTVTVDTSAPVTELIDISDATDSGENDTTTSVGNPILSFQAEAGLVVSLLGADGITTLNQGPQGTGQYTVSYHQASSTYTVSLIDAVVGGTANPFGEYSAGVATGNASSSSDGIYTIEAVNIAGNKGTIGTIRIATASLDNDGAPDAFEAPRDGNGDGIPDAQQRSVATFEAFDGNKSTIAVTVAVKVIEELREIDPITGAQITATTSVLYQGISGLAESGSGVAIDKLQSVIDHAKNKPLSSGVDVVVAVSAQPSFRVIPEVLVYGAYDPCLEQSFRDLVNQRFSNTIQQIDLYFDDPSQAWNALFKPDGIGGYFFYGYNPETGLGGVLLDRNNDGKVDGARVYLKDNQLGDLNLNPALTIIDDPVGLVALAKAPELRVGDDGAGLIVDGPIGTGLWLNLKTTMADAQLQNLLLLSTATGTELGSIGATQYSGNLGEKDLFLGSGEELRFAQSSANGSISNNPLLKFNVEGGGIRLCFDDRGSPDGDYNDLQVYIKVSIAARNPDVIAMARLQRAGSDAILDLTGIPAAGTRLSVSITADCGYTNRLGFVRLGGDSLTGYTVAGVLADNTLAFRKAVSDNLINPGGSVVTAGGKSARTMTWELAGTDAGIYAPVLINPNAQVFTFGATTASDGQQHVKVFGDNYFGFEDFISSQGSDWDFNDMSVKVSFG